MLDLDYYWTDFIHKCIVVVPVVDLLREVWVTLVGNVQRCAHDEASYDDLPPSPTNVTRLLTKENAQAELSEWFNDLREGCALVWKLRLFHRTCLAWLLLCGWCRWWRSGWFCNCIFCWRGGLMGRRIWCVCLLCRWTNKERAGHISAMAQHYICPLIQQQRTRDSPIDSCTDEAQLAGNLGSLSGKHVCLSIEHTNDWDAARRKEFSVAADSSGEFLEIRKSINFVTKTSFTLVPCPLYWYVMFRFGLGPLLIMVVCVAQWWICPSTVLRGKNYKRKMHENLKMMLHHLWAALQLVQAKGLQEAFLTIRNPGRRTKGKQFLAALRATAVGSVSFLDVVPREVGCMSRDEQGTFSLSHQPFHCSYNPSYFLLTWAGIWHPDSNAQLVISPKFTILPFQLDASLF